MKRIFALILLMAVAGLCRAQQFTNSSAQAVALGVYTAAEVDGPTQTNLTWKNTDIIINCTAYTSGTYTPHVQGFDRDGNAYDILVGTSGASTQITGTGITVLHVGPGFLAVPGTAAQVALPVKWRVILVGTSSPSMTLVVNANLGI